MAAFTSKDVMDLRARTGAGMMDCKKALTEADGDMDKAVTILREKGAATAAKKQAALQRKALSKVISTWAVKSAFSSRSTAKPTSLQKRRLQSVRSRRRSPNRFYETYLRRYRRP